MVQLLEGIHDCVLLTEISMLVHYASLVSVVFYVQLKNDAGYTLLGRAGEHPSASRWWNCITKSLQDSLRCMNVVFADGCSHTLGMNETRTQLLITNTEIFQFFSQGYLFGFPRLVLI